MSGGPDLLRVLRHSQLRFGGLANYDTPVTTISDREVAIVKTTDAYVGPWTITLGLEKEGPGVALAQMSAVVDWGADGASFRAVYDWRQGASATVHGSYVRVACRWGVGAAAIAAGVRRRASALISPGPQSSNAPLDRRVTSTSPSSGPLAPLGISGTIPIPRFAVAYFVVLGSLAGGSSAPLIVRQLDDAGGLVEIDGTNAGYVVAPPSAPMTIHPLSAGLTVQNTAAFGIDVHIVFTLDLG